MLIILEFFPALIFIFSSGLLFQRRFRDHSFLTFIAGSVALVASYFLLEQIIDRAVEVRFATAQTRTLEQQEQALIAARERQEAVRAQQEDQARNVERERQWAAARAEAQAREQANAHAIEEAETRARVAEQARQQVEARALAAEQARKQAEIRANTLEQAGQGQGQLQLPDGFRNAQVLEVGQDSWGRRSCVVRGPVATHFVPC